ncbi:hypothetical protein GJ744_012009 [Endocarpon pusillum]|uniref:Biotin carboxylation domain-containing protein n=1 Tax=Endocarpon pusillum TaxID=364733 RepID=A0A8H7EAN7_9EURO|nr:hypothetical protein GJ744_012009 [Endocarpon pusillum]
MPPPLRRCYEWETWSDMEKLRTVLAANPGKIAARIARSAKSLNIHIVLFPLMLVQHLTIFTAADESGLLSGPEVKARLDGEQIVKTAKSRSVDVISTGYGLLSEKCRFRSTSLCSWDGLTGPSPDSIGLFVMKCMN